MAASQNRVMAGRNNGNALKGVIETHERQEQYPKKPPIEQLEQNSISRPTLGATLFVPLRRGRVALFESAGARCSECGGPFKKNRLMVGGTVET